MRELQQRGVRVRMLEAEPELSIRAQVALVAWRDLCGERAFGMSVGPIPWRAVIAWCDRYRCREAETIVELVQILDVEFLNRETGANQHHQNSAAASGSQ